MTVNKLLKHKKTISLLLGSLSVLAFPPFYIFPVLFVSISLLLYFLTNSSSEKESFLLGYFFCFGFFAFGFQWMGNALLIEATIFGWLYPVVFLANGAFFGLWFAIPSLLSHKFNTPLTKLLSFSGLYVLFEWTRSFFLTGFPWNMLGSSLAFNIEMLQLASVIGTYGLSLLVLLITGSPVLFLQNKKLILIPTALLLFIYAFGYYRTETFANNKLSETRVRIVQPSIPQSMKWSKEALDDNFKKYISLSQKEGLEDIDFVIWGETATPFFLDIEPERMQEISAAIPEKGYLITGIVRFDVNKDGDYQPLNSMFVINKKGEILDHYDKAHLVPFGEYIPLRQYLPQWIRPITNTIGDFKAGNGHKKIEVSSHPSFGASICYEIIFPSRIIDKNNRPEWLINLTNDGWYGDSSGPRQHLVTTQLRAIEEGITITRVANSGISAIIDRTGKILQQIPLNKVDVLDTNLPYVLSGITIYGRFGNAIPLILCLANILIAFLLRKETVQSFNIQRQKKY